MKDERKYLVLSSGTADVISEHTKAGKKIALGAFDKKNVILTPIERELEAMDRTFQRTEENGMNEQGFVAGYKSDGKQLIKDYPVGESKGQAKNIEGWENFKKAGGKSTSYLAHSHGAVVKVDDNGDVIIGSTNPSISDRTPNNMYMQPNVGLGYNINGMNDIAAADLKSATNNRGSYVPLSNYKSLTRTITFYNTGRIVSSNYETFKSLVRVINASK